jgi:hypothetical protein
MIIKIPGKGPLTIYSDSEIVLNIPGDNPVEVIAAPVSGSTETYFAVDYFAADYFA